MRMQDIHMGGALKEADASDRGQGSGPGGQNEALFVQTGRKERNCLRRRQDSIFPPLWMSA